MEWKTSAACQGTGTDIWFVNDPRVHALLSRVCNNCPVIAECRAEGVALGERWAFRAGEYLGPIGVGRWSRSGPDPF